MPNGESKNWVRFMKTLEAFYNLHDKWPTVIHLYPFFINELQEKLSMEDFQKLQSKIRLEPDKENPFLSLDEVGNRFDYARETCPNEHHSVRAIDWLEIHEPTYFD
jgi:hypothetical protein